jgi:hypothetical protein
MIHIRHVEQRALPPQALVKGMPLRLAASNTLSPGWHSNSILS